jgi:hypothetical protein
VTHSREHDSEFSVFIKRGTISRLAEVYRVSKLVIRKLNNEGSQG